MFTLEQINDIHKKFGRADSLPDYLQALNAIGITTYDSFITDGHSEYFGSNGQMLIGPPVHERLTIADASDRDKFLEHLRLHEHGQTNYMEMSQGLADSGIEKWTFDTTNMTIKYYDKTGAKLLAQVVK